jgi:ECF transporter S component (folate family)
MPADEMRAFFVPARWVRRTLHQKREGVMVEQKQEKQQRQQKGAARAHWETRQLATMALFIALGVILSFIEFPLLPGTDFLKYDASAVPALLAGFAYGPAAGCLVGVLTAVLHGFNGDFWGALMNIIIVVAFVLPASFAYKHSKSTVSTVIGLVISCIAMVAVALLANLVVTPIYTGWPIEAIIAIIPTILLPFNILKAVINSVLGFVLLKSLGTFLRRR